VRWRTAFLALISALQSAGAQIVRGVVTERTSGQPLPGVLVTIASVPDSLRPGGLTHTLTNLRGEFGVRLSSGGRFVVPPSVLVLPGAPPRHLRWASEKPGGLT
jgi:hypothetical protein